MIRWLVTLAVIASGTLSSPAAESALVELVAPKTDSPWLGQRLDFAVEVAVEGRFGGATVFDLPELPGAILFKPEDRPVLSSRQVDGREFSVQRHGFSLFCFAPGTLAVGGIRVRCGSLVGVRGEPRSHRLEVPEFQIEPRAQPDLVPGQVVVTSRSFDVEERWDPPPGEAKAGDAFRRTVTITASDVPGMLLPKLPQPGLDGLAVYPAAPSIDDRTERGAFTGRRSDSVTYLCETGGEFPLPAIRFRCWDPDKEEWIVRELSGATFTVAGSTDVVMPDPAGPGFRWGWLVIILLLLGAGLGIAIFLRHRHDAPETAAFHDLRDACRLGSPAVAVHAFHRWSFIAETVEPGLELRAALREAEEAIASRHSWSGQQLWHEARAANRRHGNRSPTTRTGLPPLNP